MLRAPTPEAAEAAHRESHGLMPSSIIEVDEGMVKQFLGETEVSEMKGALLPGGISSGYDGGMRTILFTDIEGSTEMTNRLGDAAAMAVLKSHNQIVRASLGQWNGREVKHTGDGIMASFTSVSDGVNSAITIQRTLMLENEKSEGHPFVVRIGLSAGEPVEDSNDLFGVSVQLAARACDHAKSSQIIVSNVIPLLCVGKGFEFLDHGEVPLKGFEKPVHLQEVHWEET